MASSLGSSMTYFALTLWMWRQTQSATAIALILVFYQLPQLVLSLFSGVLIDRIPRKQLLWISDAGAACCTIAVGILAGLQILHIWHIYLIAAIIGGFGNLQMLTYSTLVPLIVPPQHHARASSMGAMVEYGAAILSPALAGGLYPFVGLLGITAIDMTTFLAAMFTLALVKIPSVNPEAKAKPLATGHPGLGQAFWRNLTYGFQYITSRPYLLTMVVTLSTFSFFHQMGEALYQPMILARTGGDAQILGWVVTASGLGGVVGAIAFSLWGGFQQRPMGLLLGFIGTGFSTLLLGLGPFPAMWATARFGSSFHNPLIMSSYMAIWYAEVSPELQGRVFSADYLVGILVMLSANLVAGPLADHVFEPWMQHHLTALTPLFGSGPGSGIALMQVLLAIAILIVGGVGLMGYLRQCYSRAEP